MNDLVPAAMTATKVQLTDKVGYTGKRRRRLIQAAVAAIIFEKYSYHIAVDLHSKENLERGLDTLWEVLAYHHPMQTGFHEIHGATEKQRYEAVARMKGAIERGFRALQKRVRNDHAARPIRLYMTSSSPDGSGSIEIVTLNPDFMVGDCTVRDLYEKRNIKHVCDKVRTVLHQADTDAIRQQAIASLEGVVAMAKQLPAPASQLELDFSVDDDAEPESDDLDVGESPS